MNVSYQLYSSRNFTPWEDVISGLAAVGYTQVEGFGSVYEDPAGFRAMLEGHGLSMPSGHFGVEALERSYASCVNIARGLGITRIYAPYLDEQDRPSDEKGWIAFAARLSAIGEKLRADGFQFGWHNHDFEFRPLADGTVPMRILLESDPKLNWEADIAWIIRGGADPTAWIDEFGARITAAHVKDIAPEGQNLDQDGWADLGEGTVDWAELVAQLRRASVDLFVMEHDNPSDGQRFAATSIETFKSY